MTESIEQNVAAARAVRAETPREGVGLAPVARELAALRKARQEAAVPRQGVAGGADMERAYTLAASTVEVEVETAADVDATVAVAVADVEGE